MGTLLKESLMKQIFKRSSPLASSGVSPPPVVMHPDQVREERALALGHMQAQARAAAMNQMQDNASVSNQVGARPWQHHTVEPAPPAPTPLSALGSELADYVEAALKLLDCEVSKIHSPHDKSVRAMRSIGSRVHEAMLVWCIRHPVLDITIQWVGDGLGGTELEWHTRLADMADKIKAEKSWFVENKKDLPKLAPPHEAIHPHMYGHAVVMPSHAMGLQHAAAQGMQGQQNVANQMAQQMADVGMSSADIKKFIQDPKALTATEIQTRTREYAHQLARAMTKRDMDRVVGPPLINGDCQF
ncbi:MAG TPA: hypothetical protein VIJ38_13590 [Acidobacteriaceae bacterium]